MEEASNTRIVAFQLMQVAHLQAIQIMARFCQGDILAMKRIQYGAHKCVAENVRGFSVAVLPAASLLFRNRLEAAGSTATENPRTFSATHLCAPYWMRFMANISPWQKRAIIWMA